MSTHTNDANKATVLAALEEVRTALASEPGSPAVTHAREQCDRLQQSISQFHAEGLRFAAFTLFRMVEKSGSALAPSVHAATRALKTSLEKAGYPH